MRFNTYLAYRRFCIAHARRYHTRLKPDLHIRTLLCIGQIEASTCPHPGQPPGHLNFLKIIVQIPPYPGQNAVQMPHTMVHSGDQMPPPRGRFTGTKLTEGRRKRLQLSNKIFINITKLRNTVSVFTKNKSLVQSGGNRCYKVTECSKRSIKKDPIY